MRLFGRGEKEENMKEAWYCEICPHRNDCSLEHKDRMRKSSNEQCSGKESE